MADGQRRRWPLVLVAVFLVLLDLFFLLALIGGAEDRTDTDGKAAGIAILAVIVAVLAGLAFLAARAAARRGRPVVAAPPAKQSGFRPPRVSTGRKVGGWALAVIFFGVAVAIAVTVVAQLGKGDSSSLGSALTGAVVCGALGFVGLSMARTPSSAERARVIGELNRLAAEARPADGAAQQLGAAASYDAPAVAGPSWLQCRSTVPSLATRP